MRSSNNPSSVFFWKDYENDEGLRVSSLAAQGLWMRLLCVAAKSDPYGFILINGTDIGLTGVARLGSIAEDVAGVLLAELEANGVFSRDRRGRMFSRRMVKDHATREKNRKNGKKGGNPALSVSARKITKNYNSDNQAANLTPSPHTHTHTHSSLRSELGGGGGAVEISQPPSFRERLLFAMGVGPDGIAGPSKFIGGQGDMAEANRWLTLPGITEDVAVQCVADLMATKRDGPPHRFSYFTPGMRRLSGEITAPPPSPTLSLTTATSRAPSAASTARLGGIVSAALRSARPVGDE